MIKLSLSVSLLLSTVSGMSYGTLKKDSSNPLLKKLKNMRHTYAFQCLYRSLTHGDNMNFSFEPQPTNLQHNTKINGETIHVSYYTVSLKNSFLSHRPVHHMTQWGYGLEHFLGEPLAEKLPAVCGAQNNEFWCMDSLHQEPLLKISNFHSTFYASFVYPNPDFNSEIQESDSKVPKYFQHVFNKMNVTGSFYGSLANTSMDAVTHRDAVFPVKCVLTWKHTIKSLKTDHTPVEEPVAPKKSVKKAKKTFL